MNITSTHHTTATFATATALAAGLTLMSAIAPTAASAHRPTPYSGPVSPCVGSVESAASAETEDGALVIDQRKAARAQYLRDNARELRLRDSG